MMTIKTHIPTTKPTNGTLATMASAIEGIPDFLKVANRPATPPPAPAPIKAPPVALAQKATVAKATPGKRAQGIPKAGKEASPQVTKAKAGVKLATKAAKAEIKGKGSKPKVAAKTAPAKPAAPAKGQPRIESKTELVGRLLKRKEGCTTADILAETRWPAVSVPQMARANHVRLRKEKTKGQPTRYFAVS